MPGLVVIAGGSPLARRVAGAVAHAFPDAVHIEPQSTPRKALLRARVRRHGIVKALGQVAFRALSVRLTARKESRIDDIWQRAGIAQSTPPAAQMYQTSSVNSRETQNLLRRLNPDLVFVFGVPKLLAPALGATAAPFINLHPGATPMYRGVHTGYWALANNDVSCFSATIHVIDNGLDTGPIIRKVSATPGAQDNVATYNQLLVVSALPALFDVLTRYLRKAELEALSAGPPNPIFHEPTLWGYLSTGLQRGVW